MNNESPPPRYTPGEDGWKYRRAAFFYLSRAYSKQVSSAIELLSNMKFELPRISKAHEQQLQPELLFRHSIPFCLTEDAYFGPSDTAKIYLAGLLAGHTLALTHLDYHLDGSAPSDTSPATARKMDLASATTYAVRMIYAAGSLLSAVDNADAMFRNVFDPISGFVILRMYEDWTERYSPEFLCEPEGRLRDYLDSPTSRLLGSGYWELMTQGCFVSHGMTAPPELIATLRLLRKLRQIVDEIADFEDDVRSGLVTVPLLFALQAGAGEPISHAVKDLWRSRTSRPGTPDCELMSEVRKLVEDSGAFEDSHKLADSLWQQACEQCEQSLGSRSRGYLLLLDLKRAKLEALARNGWRNEPTDAIFNL